MELGKYIHVGSQIGKGLYLYVEDGLRLSTASRINPQIESVYIIMEEIWIVNILSHSKISNEIR